MKIVYVIPYDWGGMPHYTAELANEVSRYAEVIVIGSKSIHSEYFSKNVKILKLFDQITFSINNVNKIFYIKNILAILSLRKLREIDKIKPDVIHFTTPLIPPLPLFILMGNLAKRYPLIYTVHSMHQDATFFIEAVSYINSLCARQIKFKRIIVHTQNDKNELSKTKAFPEEKINVIPHGVYKLFTNYSSMIYGETDNSEEKCILFFGYIKQYKGLKYLLRSIASISKEIRDFKLIIAGQGDLSPYLELINDSRSRIEIHNEFISDSEVAVLFQKATVVVLPYSQMTGQSGILNIAYAFGKPVVASDIWGFREILDNGETGFLVTPKDPEALASAIIKILVNSQLRDNMKNNILKKSIELSWQNIALKYIDLYQKAIIES